MQNDIPISITVITSQVPARLSKAFRLSAEGGLLKLSGGQMTQGTAHIRSVANLGELAAILRDLTPRQALTYGVPKAGSGRVLSRKAFADAGAPNGATTRTNDAFMWSAGGGVMMLDYDPHGATLDHDRLVQAIREAAPELAEVALLWWPSASSCIFSGDDELHGIGGQRLWLLVADAADIPRAGKALVDRLWLAGHGRIQVGGAGQLLERTLVDAAVWQPSRLDFAGGAECGPGLEQRRGDPVEFPGRVQIIDTRIAIPDLTASERATLEQLKQNARESVATEAQLARAAWVAERARQSLPPELADDPEALAQAEAEARHVLDGGPLGGGFQLLVDVDGHIQSVSVAQVLEKPSDWHGRLTRDPLEPDYGGGRLVGRLFLLQARPVLHSFAHGGRSYMLQRASTRIEVVKGGTAAAVDTTLDLLRRDPVIGDFGGELALVAGGRMHPLSEPALANHLGQTAQFWRRKGRGGTAVEEAIDPPQSLLKQVLAQGARRNLKPLKAVVSGPTLRRDGTLIAAPGYDSATQLFFDPPHEAVPDVPANPTLAEAASALAALMHPFRQFPLVNANARGALLAALLTTVVRSVLPTAPAFAFGAPVQASGKTLLAKCVAALLEGCAPDVWPHTTGGSDEETRKRLFAALRDGKRALIWDNVTGVFDSASLAAFLTSENFTDRVLGRSESQSVPNRVLLLLTGNNLTFAGDLPRRVIMCRIDPQTERPFARHFDLDPLAYVLEHRMEMLAAACTLIRAQLTHQRQPTSGRLASFEDWDFLIRQTVVWCDSILERGSFGDPLALITEAQAAEPDAEVLHALLAALQAQFGLREFTAQDVCSAIRQGQAGSDLLDVVKDLVGEPKIESSRSVGRMLASRKDRIVQGKRLLGRQDAHTKKWRYRVDECGQG